MPARRRLLSILFAALVCIPLVLALMLFAALYFGQRALIYPAPAESVAMPQGFAEVRLETDDGLQLRAAWTPPREGRPSIVFFHGNGDTLAGAAMATDAFARSGYGVLLADYRGYGGNPGAPYEAGLTLDADAAARFLAGQGIAHEGTVIMGASLGTGVATALASRWSQAGGPPAALVLVSPFTSLPDAAAAAFPWLPVRRFVHDRYDSLDTIGTLAAPVLVLHARNDAVIPHGQGRRLAGAARDGTLESFAHEGHQLQYGEAAQAFTLRWLRSYGL